MLHLAGTGLVSALLLVLPVWLASLWLRDASLADRWWSAWIAAPALTYAWASPLDGRGVAMLVLLLMWAVRLAAHVCVRNWGHGEDRRYAAIRQRNAPHFGLKSLYLVFGLQGVLAWLVGLPLLAGLTYRGPLGALDALGAALAAFGLVFEAVADAQLSRFRRHRHMRNSVMDWGLWRWSRHPNYFGEACIWWGLALMGLSAGGWAAAWCLVSPVLMTLLLLKVSGVALLEQDIAERRPAYRDYIARTSAFFPWPPRRDAVR